MNVERGCCSTTVCAVEVLSSAPSRKVAQPLPRNRVSGELYVFAVRAAAKANWVNAGRAASTISLRYSPPAFR